MSYKLRNGETDRLHVTKAGKLVSLPTEFSVSRFAPANTWRTTEVSAPARQRPTLESLIHAVVMGC
jgi:hypothetical protein